MRFDRERIRIEIAFAICKIKRFKPQQENRRFWLKPEPAAQNRRDFDMKRKAKRIFAILMAAVFMASGMGLSPVGVREVYAANDANRQVAWYVEPVTFDHWRYMAIKSDGSLWTWLSYRVYADMQDRRLQGLNYRLTNLCRPYPVHVLDDVINFSQGSGATLAITGDGQLWGWGDSRTLGHLHSTYLCCHGAVSPVFLNYPRRVMQNAAYALAHHEQSS